MYSPASGSKEELLKRTLNAGNPLYLASQNGKSKEIRDKQIF
jgi:hypothetical protein